jgi:hypothetical protein
MQRQKTPTVAGRRRQSVTLSRVAAWLGFGGAVLSQAAIFAVGYYLADDASPGGLQNAALAGAALLLGIVLMIVARRTGRRLQTSAINLGRVPLRLVAASMPEAESEHGRSAA